MQAATDLLFAEESCVDLAKARRGVCEVRRVPHARQTRLGRRRPTWTDDGQRSVTNDQTSRVTGELLEIRRRLAYEWSHQSLPADFGKFQRKLHGRRPEGI